MDADFLSWQRHRAVENAVASQRLEGLEVDAETIADMHRIADGEVTTEEIVEKVKRRILAGEFGI
ncbi:antitoxin VbhA family protein [Bordetella bronchialis]|uniref:Antitoxin VbhA domain-containing protein n=1 Tax=Bordetella bronchialis TaxID=463025 RepID=A0A193FVI3_9BORD|nr:antitoxin VbhA family protein [Bordetella bronchialis]ANN65960.1 hypothetical protein BAU06_06320 [Bordetella bronchialis]ANN71044.1 hypothetical protein BAU08_06580 [Bordetella bronchialis]